MRIALAGMGTLGAALFDAANDAGHELVAVLADPRRTTPHHRLLDWTDPVRWRARRRKLPVVRVRDGASAELAALRPELILVGNFGAILGREWLDVPTVGGVNVHWSLLPRHRGPDPAAAAILAGDSESGITFHVLTERVDAGDVLAQQTFAIGPRDTAPQLYERAARLAGTQVGAVLRDIECGGLLGTPQDLATGNYRRRITQDEARIRWTGSSEYIDRLVRACTRPMAWFSHRGRRVYVSACTPWTGAGNPGRILSVDPLVVGTGTGSLRIDRAVTRWPPFTWPGWPALRPGATLDPAPPAGR